MGADTPAINVFISYSRADLAFVDQLVVALKRFGYNPVIDREGISPGEDWRSGLGELILSSDSVVFVLSPDFAASEICQWEVEETERLGKRLVPVLARDLEGAEPPVQLQKLNYIHFYDDEKVTNAGFGSGLVKLDEALSMNADWIKEHTRLGELAARWEARARPESLLLSGAEFSDFKEWRKNKPPRGAALSELQAEFMRESEQAEEQRRSLERQKIDAMNAALKDREDALVRAAAAQDKVRRLSFVSIAVGAVLTVAAVAAGLVALGKAAEADRQSSKIFAAQARALNDQSSHDKALLFALEADPDGPGGLFAKKPNPQAVAQLLRSYLNSSLIRTHHSHKDGVAVVAFSPDGAFFASGSGDATAKIWDARTGELVRTLEGHENRVTSLEFSADSARLLTGAGDGMIKLWRVADGGLIRTYEGHQTWVNAVRFSKDGTRILSGSGDKTAKLWDTASGETLRTFSGHEGRVSAAIFSPDEAEIYTGSEYGVLKIWDAETGAESYSANIHENWINAIEFSPDDARYLTSSGDALLKLWNSADRSLEKTLEGHESRINDAVFSPDGKMIASGAGDFDVLVWDVATGAIMATHAGHDSWVYGVAFSPDQKKLVSGAWDNTVKSWALPRPGEEPAAAATDAVTVAATNKSDFVLYNNGAVSVALASASNPAEPIARFSHDARIIDAAFSDDGMRAATSSADGAVKLWDVATGQLYRIFAGHERMATGVRFSPDGKQLLTTSADGTAMLWNADTGAPLRTFAGHEGRINDARFLDEGARILTASADARVLVWNARTDEEPATLLTADSRIHAIDVSPDGRLLATALGGNDILLWDLASGEAVKTMVGHREWVRDVAFSPDGRYLVSGSQDASAILWDVTTGEPLKRFEGHRDRINKVAYGADGSYFVTASADGSARVWTIDPILNAPLSDQIELACVKAAATQTEAFTDEDRQLYAILENVAAKPCG